jgi:hypothetical protein
LAVDRDEFNLQAAFEFARDTIKHLLLVNGGAVVALLTFYGSLLDRPLELVPREAEAHAFCGLVSFAVGVAAAVFCALFSYLTQLKWGIAKSDASEASDEAWAGRFHILAMFAASVSALAFVIGVWQTAKALLNG